MKLWSGFCEMVMMHLCPVSRNRSYGSTWTDNSGRRWGKFTLDPTFSSSGCCPCSGANLAFSDLQSNNHSDDTTSYEWKPNVCHYLHAVRTLDKIGKWKHSLLYIAAIFHVNFSYFFRRNARNYGTEVTYADVGTTAEIYEAHEGTDQVEMRIKAIGRQRFKLLELRHHAEG